MYKIKQTEWELNKEEQEKAKFILKTIERINKLASKGTPMARPEIAAFDHFKSGFYVEVAHRLGVRLAQPFLSGPNDFAAMGVTDDGKRVIGYRVEKV